MSDEKLSGAMATLVNRLTDRFLPKPTPHGWRVVFGCSLVGGLVWAVAATLFEVARSGSSVSPFLGDVAGNLIFLVFALAFASSGVLSILLAASFRRGSPLVFYFYGLLMPVFTVRVLRYAVPF